MNIVYASKTGNVKRFIAKLDRQSIRIKEDLLMDEPFVLVTYTTGFGQVPSVVTEFLEQNHHHLRGVAASGNKNWGDSYARSADTIAAQYQVPVVCKFELSGTEHDLKIFQERVKQLETY
ncbi:class Ib ribonucleoside-diphosphate reductase assembly flavoprotein NrdI [Ammoniphilus resinae]|uniref:Protein NrdI n=1 Tax=Ammoniphilus resinae TaxID=861532 RepID=A0ABS4GP55_9BACL|nr:class Ib ribonucleoside-diphosphate reductase assembly flavoprotein NrdI [Ammoniphilus resinae]MBP1932060.1 protein involved in ribonucleotide reduction [Ammoniphilus resinae]